MLPIKQKKATLEKGSTQELEYKKLIENIDSLWNLLFDKYLSSYEQERDRNLIL
jgi:hypothetical protein